MKNTGSLRNILSVFFKYRHRSWTILAATLATVAIGTFAVAPLYEATSTVLIKFGREYEYLPEVGEGRGAASYYNREGIINTEIQILLSRDLLERTCKAIGLDKLYPNLSNGQSSVPLIDRVVEKFTEDLSVVGSNKSNILNISFKHSNPELAAASVNLLVDLFEEKHVQTFSDQKVNEFLKEKVAFYRDRLEASARNNEVFKQQNKTFEYQSQIRLLLEERAHLAELYKKSKSQAVALREKLKSIESQLQGKSEIITLYSETGGEVLNTENAKSTLLGLQLEEKALLEKYGENSPKIANVRQRIDLAKQFLKEQKERKENRQTNVRVGKSEVFQDIEKVAIQTKSELQSIEAHNGVLEEQLKKVDEELLSLSQKEQQLNDLIREFQIDEKNYQTYQAKLEDSRISTELDRQKMTNIRVVERAVAPSRPVWPNKGVNLSIGTLLGLFFGIGFGFFSEFISQGLSSGEAIRKKLNLPLLATRFAQSGPGARNNASNLAAGPSRTADPLPIDQQGESNGGREMVGLCHAVNSSLHKETNTILQVVSALDGEGSGIVARDFARTLVTTFGKKVLLLSTDPPASRSAGAPTLPVHKVVDQLTDDPLRENWCVRSDLDGLWIVHSACFGQPLSAIFSSDHVDQFLSALKKHFEIVVIDSPPLSISPDCLAVARKADGIVIVIASETTRWPVVNNLTEKIQQVNGNILGAVLNGQKTYIPAAIYRLL